MSGAAQPLLVQGGVGRRWPRARGSETVVWSWQGGQQFSAHLVAPAVEKRHPNEGKGGAMIHRGEGMRGVGRLWTLLCAVGLFLTACSSLPSLTQPHLRSARHIPLDDTIAAFVMNPWSTSDPFVRASYLVLVERGGGTRVYRTGFSEAAHLLWGSAGLVVADSEHDYVIDREGEVSVFDAPKGSIANGAAFLGGSAVVASLTNEGFVEGRYRQQVGITTPSGSRQRSVGVYTDVFGACGESAYILGGEVMDSGEGAGRERVFFQQVVAQGDFDYRELRSATSEFDEVSYAGPTAPCQEDTMVVLAEQVEYLPGEGKRIGNPAHYPIFEEGSPLTQFQPGSRSYASIERWDVTTGRRRIVALKDPQGEFLRLPSEEILNASYGPGAYVDGQLRWISGGGEVYSTDVESGVTESLHGLTLSGGYDSRRFAVFSGQRLDVLSHTTGTQGAIELYSYDLRTGRELARQRIDDLWSSIDPDTQILRGFAVNPVFLGPEGL